MKLSEAIKEVEPALYYDDPWKQFLGLDSNGLIARLTPLIGAAKHYREVRRELVWYAEPGNAHEDVREIAKRLLKKMPAYGEKEVSDERERAG